MRLTNRHLLLTATAFILLAISKFSSAALLGDNVTVNIDGASVTPQSFQVTDIGGPEATFSYGSDESIEIDAGDTFFDLTFFDFTGVWQWSADPFVIEFTDVDFPGGIAQIDVTGTFFDGVALTTQIISPTSFTVSGPFSMVIQNFATEADVRVALSNVPIPAAIWLMASGLAGIATLTVRRKPRR